jgi:lysylphosphatidylglycerol synthetase-like protein (DUF2156 family)
MGDQLVAFAIYNPIYTASSYYLDANRRHPEAPNGTMELLMHNSFKTLKSEGAQRVYLGLCPLAHLKDNVKENGLLRTLALLASYHLLRTVYPTKSEYFFKRKFWTRVEKRYLYYAPRLSIRMVYALFRAFCTQGLRGLLLHKLHTGKWILR